ncbi:ImmA/IrrE family metallo-endopeptidase [Myxococcus faecalis]|uniref:ImmA/IrrE family metallo-endopeptidase n=1 Tax=Myxococcus faecalis TaxID=3115646 RepID=UPI003CE7C37E
MFTSSRLTLARRRRMMTQAGLAEAIGVSVRMVVAYESGEKPPGDETLADMARVLGFPEEFFEGDDLEDIPVEYVSFRALSSMLARQREAARAAGTLALELNSWIDKRFSLLKADVPDLRHFEPEAAAVALRAAWGLGERPIKNMVHLLEAHGIRVFSLAENNREVDAFSFWKGGTPFVFLNTMKNPERGRFDAGHELGHLVLHRHGEPGGREAEQQANAFASSFLMPRASVVAHAPRSPRLDVILGLRSIWGVSASALVRRMHDVNMISDWNYRSLSIEIGQRGLRDSEDTGRERETSQVLEKVFAQLRAEGVSKADVARELRLHKAELEALIFGLVPMSAVSGGRSGEASPLRRGGLKLVR